MKRQNILMGALALALVSTPAAADPISEFLDAVFSDPPSDHRPVYRSTRYGWRRAEAHSAVSGGNMVASYYGGGENRTLSDCRCHLRALPVRRRRSVDRLRKRRAHRGLLPSRPTQL